MAFFQHVAISAGGKACALFFFLFFINYYFLSIYYILWGTEREGREKGEMEGKGEGWRLIKGPVRG